MEEAQKLVLVAVAALLVAGVGIFLMLNISQQTMPAFLIEPNPLAKTPVTVFTDALSYEAGDGGLISYELDQPAYVYLLNYQPKAGGGYGASLLMPSEQEPIYYDESGSVSFSLPDHAGRGYVQAITSPVPLSLPDLFETSNLIAPKAVKNRVLTDIQRRGLGSTAWASSWSVYNINKIERVNSGFAAAGGETEPLAAPSPSSATTPSRLKVLVVQEGYCQMGSDIPDDAKILNAFVYVDSDQESVNTRDPDRSKAPAQAAFQMLNVEEGLRTIVVSVPAMYEISTTPILSMPDSALSRNRIQVDQGEFVQVCFEMTPLPDGTAQFGLTPFEPTVNQEVQFSAARSNGETYTWDFGDGSDPIIGTSESVEQVTHTFTTPGIYNVILTVHYDRRDMGFCMDALRTRQAKCVVEQQIQVGDGSSNTGSTRPGDGGGNVIIIDADKSLVVETTGCFSEEENRCGVDMMVDAADINGALSGLEFAFNFRFKQFYFRPSDLHLLEADSYMKVELDFIDDQGEAIFPNEMVFCTLQTDEDSMWEGCNYVIPTGENVSGTVSMDLLTDQSTLRAINRMIDMGIITQIRVNASAHLNVRLNDLDDAPIEVEYFDAELRIEITDAR